MTQVITQADRDAWIDEQILAKREIEAARLAQSERYIPQNKIRDEFFEKHGRDESEWSDEVLLEACKLPITSLSGSWLCQKHRWMYTDRTGYMGDYKDI